MKSNSYVEIFKSFLLAEKEKNFFILKLKDVYFWDLIRNATFEEILKSKKMTHQSQNSYLSHFIIIRIIQFIYYYFKSFFSTRRYSHKINYLFMNHHRKIKKNGYYECLYTELITDSLNPSSYLVLEDPMGDIHFEPSRTHNLMFTDSFLLTYYFSRIFDKIIIRSFFSIHEFHIINTIHQFINSHFYVDIPLTFYTHLIKVNIMKFKVFYKYFIRLLIKTTPNLVTVTISYDLTRQAMIKASRELNIPTVELQHGSIGPYHICYNFLAGVKPNYFPDNIFLYGEYWKQSADFPISKENLNVVGWPSFEMNFNKRNHQLSKNKCILFLSQPTIGLELSNFALNLAIILPKDYSIIYKLHPGEYHNWKSRYPLLVHPLIKVIDSSDVELSSLFIQSNIQVGVSSTSLFEGFAYNLITYIVPLNSFEQVEDLINLGHFHLVNNEEDLLYKIFNNNKIVNNNVDFLWTFNSIELIKNSLQKISHNSHNVS
jgi:hypothetical protein